MSENPWETKQTDLTEFKKGVIAQVEKLSGQQLFDLAEVLKIKSEKGEILSSKLIKERLASEINTSTTPNELEKLQSRIINLDKIIKK